MTMELGVNGLNAKAALAPAVTARLVEDFGYTSWWVGDHVVLPDGRHVRFADVDAHPRPVRAGGPRIVVGGHSDAALRRALTRGHGWFGVGTPDELAANLARLERVAAEVERPARLGHLEITAMQLQPVDHAAAERFAELGVDRLLVYPLPLEDPDDIARFLERHAGLVR